MRHTAAESGGIVLALVLAALMACAEEGKHPPPAPASLRGAIVIEPPRIGIGETASVEVAVITPPGHRVAPVPTPERVEGFWILGVEAPSVERSAHRWIHRTRFRIRASETGSFAWPGERLEVEAPDGSRSTVEIAERPLLVEEVSKEFPGRRVFFPVRTPQPERWGRGALLPAAVGALFALSGVGLLALVRRVRSRSAAATRSPAVEDSTPWEIARSALADASELARRDPCRASDMASGALRRLVSRRFRTAAMTQTTEELEATDPPYAIAARWTELLALLRRLDGVRFLPAEGVADARGQMQAVAAIREAQALVAELAPRDSWR